MSSDITGHLPKQSNNDKDRLGLKSCKILKYVCKIGVTSLRPIGLVFLIFTCSQQKVSSPRQEQSD